MKIQISRTRLWIVLSALILLAGMVGQPAALAKEPSSAAIEHAVLSAVKLWLIDADTKVLGSCSGTVIDPTGFILTNFHCVGQTDLYGEDDTGMGLKDGDLYNPDGLVVVGPTLDPKRPPKPTYVAKYVIGDTKLDVAVVKIIATLNENEPLPKTLPLVVIKRADSDKYKVGDFIATVGYPSVGGPLISYLSGEISGFDDQDSDGTLDSFKTSANISPGNSGGLGMNDNGEQIGIPTWSIVKGAEKIARFKMVNIAEPIIQKAFQMAGVAGGSGPGGSTKPDVPPAKPANPPANGFGKLQFGTDQKNGQLVNPGTAFPSGTTNIATLFDYGGMKNGTDWGYQWFIDGEAVAGKSTGNKWKDGASGTYALSLHNNGKAMPNGSYKLTLYVGGKAVSEGAFTVGQTGTKPPPKATPPPAQAAGAVLKGQIVDADTQRGIPGALVIILKPGVTISQFAQALQAGGEKELVEALGIGDQSGNYQTVPDIAKGKTYSAVVIADGYSPRTFENGLEITANDPDVIKMKPIALQKR